MITWQQVEAGLRKFIETYLLPDLNKYETGTKVVLRGIWWNYKDDLGAIITKLHSSVPPTEQVNLSKFGIYPEGVDVDQLEKAIEFVHPENIDVIGYAKKMFPLLQYAELCAEALDSRLAYELEPEDMRKLFSILKVYNPKQGYQPTSTTVA